MSLLNLETSIEALPLAATVLKLDQAILDALPIGVYACDGDGQIIRVNRRAIELWGRAEFIAPENTPTARAVLSGESSHDVEAVVWNSDERRWIARVNIAQLQDAGGISIGTVNCF